MYLAVLVFLLLHDESYSFGRNVVRSMERRSGTKHTSIYGKSKWIMSSGSPSKRPQMQEYTIIPIIGTYVPSSDVRTDAVYLSKPNMRIVELKDIEKPGKIEGEVEVYERRVAKAVIPVPLTRGLICIHTCIYVLMNT